MSNLKHLSKEELVEELKRIDKSINYYHNKANGFKTRREWANHYLKLKSQEEKTQ